MSAARLALDGGSPVRIEPMPGWPCFPASDVESAASVLRSGKVNYWTGEMGRRFESVFADAVGTEHAVAMMNGTVALECALRAVGVGPGAVVIVPSRSFVASANAVILAGGTVRFADVDVRSQNLTAATVEPLLEPGVRAVLPVHLAGWPADVPGLQELCAPLGVSVVEDCAQALGASLYGSMVGSLGDAAAFSFCQDKIITTGGEGGMVTTSARGVYERVWSYKDHGKRVDQPPATGDEPWRFRWLHETVGSNYRMTEMQAALGVAAMARLDDEVAGRRRNAAVLDEGLRDLETLRVEVPEQGVRHAYYKYYVYIRPEALKGGWSRDRFAAAVNAEGVPCFSGACPEIYLEAAYRDSGMAPAHRLPVARRLGEESLMFLVHPTMGEAEMADTVEAVRKVSMEAAR